MIYEAAVSQLRIPHLEGHSRLNSFLLETDEWSQSPRLPNTLIGKPLNGVSLSEEPLVNAVPSKNPSNDHPFIVRTRSGSRRRPTPCVICESRR
jgi:hypothetical protein